ncbi:MAG: hypothetical protein ACD_45C00715G0002, partial [uncultured bacterium]
FEFLLAVDNPRQHYSDDEWPALIHTLLDKKLYNLVWSLLEKTPSSQADFPYLAFLQEVMIASQSIQVAYDYLRKIFATPPSLSIQALELLFAFYKSYGTGEIESLRALSKQHQDIIDRELLNEFFVSAVRDKKWQLTAMLIEEFKDQLNSNIVNTVITKAAKDYQWNIVQTLFNLPADKKPTGNAVVDAMAATIKQTTITLANPRNEYSPKTWITIVALLCHKCAERALDMFAVEDIACAWLKVLPNFNEKTITMYQDFLKKRRTGKPLRKALMAEHGCVIADLLMLDPISIEILTQRSQKRGEIRKAMQQGLAEPILQAITEQVDVINPPFILEFLSQLSQWRPEEFWQNSSKDSRQEKWKIARLMIDNLISAKLVPEILSNIISGILRNAASDQQWDMLQMLVECAGENSLDQNDLDSTLRTLAVAGPLPLLQWFIELPGNAPTPFALNYALEQSIKEGRFEVLQFLFNRNKPTALEIERALEIAARKHYSQIVAFLLADYTTEVVNAMLEKAAYQHNWDVVRELIQLSGNNKPDKDGMGAALQYAAAVVCSVFPEDVALVKTLLHWQGDNKPDANAIGCALEFIVANAHLNQTDKTDLVQTILNSVLGHDQRLVDAYNFVISQMAVNKQTEKNWRKQLEAHLTPPPKKTGIFGLLNRSPLPPLTIPGYPLAAEELTLIAKVIQLQPNPATLLVPSEPRQSP